jgi:hypothetical protein
MDQMLNPWHTLPLTEAPENFILLKFVPVHLRSSGDPDVPSRPAARKDIWTPHVMTNCPDRQNKEPLSVLSMKKYSILPFCCLLRL